ncbi:MAG: TIGR03118 family protein [Isosphaeraceae bacterium]
MHTFVCRVASITFSLLLAVGTTWAGDVYVQTNLVSDIPGMAPNTDPNLQGAWGLSFSTGSPFWVSAQNANFNGSGAASVYKVSDTQIPTSSGPLLTVGVANQGGAPPSGPAMTNGPTGQVNTTAPGITTGSGDFLVGTAEAHFIFANLDGSISGWNGGAKSTIETTVAGASFTGLAIGNLPGPGGAAQLYAADQNSGNIDVINNKWQMTSSFSDPNFAKFPAGYAAFNVQNLSVNGIQTLFVTYANQSTSGGIVDEFSTNGTFIKTLISDTAGVHLAAPWGLAIAPAGWGQFGGDLLVGNNNAGPDGLTEINAYNLSGVWQGTLTLDTGQPFSATELWALSFGNGGSAGSTDTLFFTAGLSNNTDGLFGAISSVPEPSSAVLGLIALGVLAGSWRWKNRRRNARS